MSLDHQCSNLGEGQLAAFWTFSLKWVQDFWAHSFSYKMLDS
jgi:hypothetical protein